MRGSFEPEPWLDMLSRLGQRNYSLNTALTFGRRFQKPVAQRAPGYGRALLTQLERERSRIARDLHAGAGQPLAGIRMNLEILGASQAEMTPAARQVLQRLQTLADEALQQIRAVSHRLHPPAWQELGIADALRRLVKTSGLAERFDVNLCIDGGGQEPSVAARIVLYRCAQECISNLSRHSGATRADIRLRTAGRWIELEIADNGRGFSPEDRKGSGIGLRALDEHVASLGGRARISSQKSGTTVLVTVPADPDLD